MPILRNIQSYENFAIFFQGSSSRHEDRLDEQPSFFDDLAEDGQARHQPGRQRRPAGIVVIDRAKPLFEETQSINRASFTGA